MKKILYVCENPFIMYKILIKAFEEEGVQKDLIISDNIESMQPLIEPIRQSGLFEVVYTYHYNPDDKIHTMKVERGNNVLTSFLLFCKRYIRATLHQKDLKSEPQLDCIDFTKYTSIFTSDFDVSIVNGYLAVHRIPYTLMEHAKYVFDNKNVGLVYNILTYISSFLERLGLVTGIRIATKYCECVEVHENKNLGRCLRLKKIREWNVDQAVAHMAGDDKEKIFRIYAEAYGISLKENLTYNLLLTNPLYKDNLVNSEREQVNFYKKVIDKYFDREYPVLVKPHPRDEVDYESRFDGIQVIPKGVSSEILTLGQSLHLKKVLTFYSTSAEVFRNKAEEICCIEKSEIDARQSTILEQFLRERSD